MEHHDIEIEVRKGGEVKVHVRGVAGERCLDYVRFLAEAVGRIKEQQLTREYYEREGKVRVDARQEQHVRRAEQ
jgi:hypothetical protein